MKIEVAYATPEKQLIVEVEVEEGTTVQIAAMAASQLEAEFPGLVIEGSPLGIFGKKVTKPTIDVVREGDRIEIYRPLKVDPKQARANRAAKAKPTE